jgi:ubiquinol-cytochrome c reductase cytochrome b subunit
MEAFEKTTIGLYRWLDERLGIGPVLKATALHQVPKSVNWWYVFGSAVLTCFIFQIVTGIFLIFTYVPTPQSAYSSLVYLTDHQFAGNLVRGLHFWGASAMIGLIFIHMSAHFLTGSYKYPRELQWLTGGVLLILTIVMAFTGQLLRWNQDAYWAIVVGAQQAARTPFLGVPIAQLILGGKAVGGTTLSNIYAVHIWLVPGALLTFVLIHVYLVIYKGISEWPVPGRPVDPKTYWGEYQQILHEDGEPFFPRAMFKDAVMATLVILFIGILAVVFGAQALGPQANPAIPANPKPDWYLEWYFGVLALIGVSPGGPAITPYIIILFPAICFAIVFLIPLANKGERHPFRRPWAIATVLLAGVVFTVLTIVAYQEQWKPLLTPTFGTVPLPRVYYANLSAEQQLGAQNFGAYACTACHMINSVGGTRGPDLTTVGNRLSVSQLTWRINTGGGGMPAYGSILSPKDLNSIVAFLETQRGGAPAQAASSGGTP